MLGFCISKLLREIIFQMLHLPKVFLESRLHHNFAVKCKQTKTPKQKSLLKIVVYSYAKKALNTFSVNHFKC